MIRQLENHGIAYQAEDGSVYFRLSQLPGLRPARPSQSRRAAPHRPHPQRRVRKGKHRRLRPLEGVGRGRRRGRLGFPLGPRPAGLAHRVQRHGRPPCSARRSTSIAAAWTTSSRTTRPRSRNRNAAPAKNSSATGCTAPTSWSRARKWPSPSATSTPSATSPPRAGRDAKSVTRSSPSTTACRSISPSTAWPPPAARWPASTNGWPALRPSPARRTAPPHIPSPPSPSFQDALDDDLNISGALGHLFDTIRESNRLMDQNEFTAADARALLNGWSTINHVLAFDPDASAIPAEIQSLIDARDAARKRKDWTASDQLRDELARLGWEIKDIKEGQRVMKTKLKAEIYWQTPPANPHSPNRAPRAQPISAFRFQLSAFPHVPPRIPPRPRSHRSPEALRERRQRLGRPQADRQLSPVPPPARHPGPAGRQALHLRRGLHRQGDRHRAWRHDQRPRMDRRGLRNPQRLLHPRERHRRQRRHHGQLERIQELHHLRRGRNSRISTTSATPSSATRATSPPASSSRMSASTAARSPSPTRAASSPPACGNSAPSSATARRSAATPCSLPARSSAATPCSIPARYGVASAPENSIVKNRQGLEIVPRRG